MLAAPDCRPRTPLSGAVGCCAVFPRCAGSRSETWIVFSRLTVVLIALALATPLATALAAPNWVTSIGLDVWNVPELREQLATAAEEDQELEVRKEEINRRIEVKEELVRGLIDGRSTLAA